MKHRNLVPLLTLSCALTCSLVNALELDPSRPAQASREICNPTDPAVLWDVVFTDAPVDGACKSFTATDLVPGTRFMVVQGEHSLTVRYPESQPPIVTGLYDKIVNGAVRRCVTVSMPDGLMLQSRPPGDGARGLEEAQPYQTLTCFNTAGCSRGDGTCCCGSPNCDCFLCICSRGCPDCWCDGADGGIWPANPGGRHATMRDGWRAPRPGGATLEAGGHEQE